MSYHYTYTLSHPGLGKSKVLKAASRSELQQKADAQLRIWNDLYSRQRQANAVRTAKANKAARVDEAQDEAENRTKEAQRVLDSIGATLKTGIKSRLSFSWDNPHNYLPYPIAQPEVTYQDFPPQPQPTDSAFVPQFGLLDMLVGPLHERKVADAQKHYQEALANWEKICAGIGQNNDALEADYLGRITKWKVNKHAYEQSLVNAIATTDRKQQRYKAASAPEVIEYNTKILELSSYPEFFDKSFDLDFNGVKRVLVINYDLPAFSEFPTLENVKYVKAKDTFSESNISTKEAAALYANFVYQVCLRTVYETINSDVAKVVSGVAFNGYVSATNPATGNVERTCVIALNTTPDALAPLKLIKVDPEECFKSLGGRSSQPLHKYRPITPASVETSKTVSSPEWISILKQKLAEASGTLVLRIGELQQLVGTVSGNKVSLGDGRSLVTLLAEGGFSMEPDASILAQSYRETDAVAVFIPQAQTDLRASTAYQGAAAILSMCGLVAVADGRPDPYEIERTRQCAEQAFTLSQADMRRFDALLKVLLVNGDCLWRALPKVVNQLRPDLKEWAAEVATYVGIKNGRVEKTKQNVLHRIFQTVGLSVETESRIIAKYTTTSSEVVVQEADRQPVGEVIAKAPMGLQLDMSRVAAIAQETRDLVAKLSEIMEDKEAKAEAPLTVASPNTLPTHPSLALSSNYIPIYQELITQPQWSKIEFDKLATKYDLMPIAVTDVINAWSDDALGDFLIEGNDPVIIHSELQPQER